MRGAIMETPSSRATSDLISKSLESTAESPGRRAAREADPFSAMVRKAMDDPSYPERVCPGGGCTELREVLLEVVERSGDRDDSPEVKDRVADMVPVFVDEHPEWSRARQVAEAFSACREGQEDYERAFQGQQQPEFREEQHPRGTGGQFSSGGGGGGAAKPGWKPAGPKGKGPSEAERKGYFAQKKPAAPAVKPEAGRPRPPRPPEAKPEAGRPAAPVVKPGSGEARVEERKKRVRELMEAYEAETEKPEGQEGKPEKPDVGSERLSEEESAEISERRRAEERKKEEKPKPKEPSTLEDVDPEEQKRKRKGEKPPTTVDERRFAARAGGGKRMSGKYREEAGFEPEEAKSMAEAVGAMVSKAGFEEAKHPRGFGGKFAPKAGEVPPHMMKFTRESAFRRVDDAMGRVYPARRALEEARGRQREIEGDPESAARMGAGAKEDVHGKMFALEEAAYDAAKMARYALSGVRGLPGIDEAKRSDLELRMGNFAYGGVNSDEIDAFESAMNEVTGLLEPEPEGEAYPLRDADRAREEQQAVARTIMSQMGGAQFALLTGARNFVAIPGKATRGGVQFSIPKGRGGINRVRVELDPSDTYNVEFGRVRVGDYKAVSSHTNIYFDQLQDLFESETGLFTSFMPRKGMEMGTDALRKSTEALLSKDGTSEGAKLGWETRRRGGGAEQPRQDGVGAALSDAESVIGLINEYRPKISNAESDYKMVLEEATERGERNPPKAAEGTLSELSGKVYSLLGQLRSKTGDAVKRGKDFIGANANPKEREDYEFRRQHAMDDVDEMTNVAHTARAIARRMGESGKSLNKEGTSEGAKLGWETRRRGGAAPEAVAGAVSGLPTREQWDKFQSDSDDLYDVSRDAVKVVEQIEGQAKDEADERRRFTTHPFGEKEPTTPKGVEQALNKLADAAPKAADLAAKLRGVPGVDEGKRKAAEDKMLGWKDGVDREDMQSFNDTIQDISSLVDGARAEHDPKYMEGSEPVTRPAVGMGKDLALKMGVQKRFLGREGKPTPGPEDVRPPRRSTLHDGELGLKMDAQKRLLADEDFKPVRPLRTDPNAVATGLGRLMVPGWAKQGGQVAPPREVPKDRIVGDGLTERFMPSVAKDEE